MCCCKARVQEGIERRAQWSQQPGCATISLGGRPTNRKGGGGRACAPARGMLPKSKLADRKVSGQRLASATRITDSTRCSKAKQPSHSGIQKSRLTRPLLGDLLQNEDWDCNGAYSDCNCSHHCNLGYHQDRAQGVQGQALDSGDSAGPHRSTCQLGRQVCG